MFALIAAVAVAQDAPQVTVTVAEGTEPAAHTVPLRLSLVPGVGLGAHPDDAVDGASFGVISHGSGLDGFDAELGWSFVDGPVDGAQMSMGANWADTLEGAQIALGANAAKGEMRGFQGSLGANVAGGRMEGVQATLGVNVAAAAGSEGVQLSNGVNVAKDFDGLQAAMVNVADQLEGAQLGLVNVGGDVDGLQLGLVNIARTSKVSIAPINLIGDGLHRVDVWVSESAVASVGLKLGSKQVYTLVGAGLVNPTQPWWTFGGGFGLHLGRDPLWLEVDDSVWGLAKGNMLAPGLHNKLRVQVGLDLVDHLAPFVGVSMNTWVGTGAVWPQPVGLPSHMEGRNQVVSWPGVHAGLSF